MICILYSRSIVLWTMRSGDLIADEWVQARSIPDSHVTLPSLPDEPALVQSSSHPGTLYQVLNPLTNWACCECPWAQQGNICKHQLKVIAMQTHASEIQLMQRLGTFKGQANGGMQALQTSLQADTPLLETEILDTDQPEAIECQHTPLPSAQPEQPPQKEPAKLHQTDDAALLSMLQTMLAESVDDPELRDIMAAGLAATLGTIRNAKAAQQGSMPHPLAAHALQPLPGDNSMQRWIPLCEQPLAKSRRKRQSAQIAAAAIPADASETPAAPLPIQTKASKKKSFRQQLSAGVLAEQALNVMANSAQPAPAPISQQISLPNAPKENQPVKISYNAAPSKGLARLFGLRK